MSKPKKPQFVQSSSRKAVARPQPPMQDSRTSRDRDRSSRRRNAIYRSMRGD